MAWRPTRPRRWRPRLLALALGLVAGLGLAELVARLAPGTGVEGLVYGAPVGVPGDAYQGDDTLFQVPRPGWSGRVRGVEYEAALRFDALGLRGALGPEPRALLLGDSFALAAQVDEDQTLAARLGARVGLSVENAGVDGYSTWQATGRYQRLADALRPRLVILLFFLGNDLADNERFPMLQGQRYSPRPDQGDSGPRSALLAYARVAARAWALRDEGAPERARFQRELAIFTTAGAPLLTSQLPATEAALTELRDAVAARGARLVVALAPPAFALAPEKLARTLPLVGLSGPLDVDAPRRELLATTARLGLMACDLSPALSQVQGAYFVFDGHWTPAGNAAAAEALAACIGPAED